MSGASRAPSGGTRRTAHPPLGALCKARYRITSIGLPPQESRDVQQILRVGGRSQPIPDRSEERRVGKGLRARGLLVHAIVDAMPSPPPHEEGIEARQRVLEAWTERSRILLARIEVFFFQAEDGIRDTSVTGVQTCALPISTVSHQSACRRRKAGMSSRSSESVAARSPSP